jgi:CheY-like chemotaxis protein
MVHGDVHRLTQLVTNLLNNAARYTSERGSISLSVKAEQEKIVLRVRDNGRGIEPEHLSRIFDMFVQGRSPEQRLGGGLGIGLALARKIAELHRGSLEAASAGAGKGSEFTLRLAAAEGKAASDAGAAAALPASGAGQRVLIVDDNADAADTLQMVLRSLGYDARVAHDGASALELAPQFRPHFVLLDIGMPGLDGYEVARRLRAMNVPGMRIIAITGWGQAADRQRAREAGFDVHLVKPVEPAELVKVLH